MNEEFITYHSQRNEYNIIRIHRRADEERANFSQFKIIDLSNEVSHYQPSFCDLHQIRNEMIVIASD